MKLSIVSTDNLDFTITVLVDGVRYEYWIKHHSYWSVQDRVRSYIRMGFSGRAINYLKKNSYKVDNLEKDNAGSREDA